MTYDAKFVHEDIAKGVLGDWQSPVMTVLWGVIDPIAPGPGSMFLLTATCYWLGFGLLAFALARPLEPAGAIAAAAGAVAAGLRLCRDHLARCAVCDHLAAGRRDRLRGRRMRRAVSHGRCRCWRLRCAPSASCCVRMR